MNTSFFEAIEDLNNDFEDMSTSYVDKMLEDTLQKLEDLFGKVVRQVSISLDLDATGIFGICALVSAPTGQYTIQINKYLLKYVFKDVVINNICHEMCHFLVAQDAISKGYYTSDGKNFPNIRTHIEYEESNGEGHGTMFFKYADEINQKVHLRIPITAHIDIEVFKSVWAEYKNAAPDGKYYNYRIFCDACNELAKRIDKLHVCQPDGSRGDEQIKLSVQTIFNLIKQEIL